MSSEAHTDDMNVHGSDVSFRAGGRTRIQAPTGCAPMGLEVHEHGRVGRTGWSVTVTGTASMVDDAVAATVLDIDTAHTGWLLTSPQRRG